MNFKNMMTLVLFALITQVAFANNNAAKTAHYFQTIKNKPEALTLFLQKMPKGGDLHVHIDGAVYAENLINYAAHEGFCIHPNTNTVYKNPQCPQADRLQNIPYEPNLYKQVINAWSMRNFPIKVKSGEKHFFHAFPKFEPLVVATLPKVIAGIANRAGDENEIYLELMIGGLELQVTDTQGKTSADIGKQIGIKNDLATWRQQLLTAGIQQIVTKTDNKITRLNKKIQRKLKCGTNKAASGCQVNIRYQYFALRDLPLAQFYGQLVTAFAVANTNASVVGINMVMPENWEIALKDYTKQMQMIGYLHKVYPKVNITLHAGELYFGQVPPKDLTYHIRQAIHIAHAQRIGHGVDIAYEKNPRQLLKEMAKKHILVEINLTSNADVLGVTGKNHPLPLYLRNHVPVALSTDDEGIERTDLTHEYERAVLTYGFSYATLKRFARNSITYSFLPGKSLWENANRFTPVKACATSVLGSKKPSNLCKAFLSYSEKARMQWKLEGQFQRFEKHYAILFP